MPELRATAARYSAAARKRKLARPDCRLPRASLPRRIGHTPSKSFALDASPRPRSHGVGPPVRHSAQRAERFEKGTRGVCQRPRETPRSTQQQRPTTYRWPADERRRRPLLVVLVGVVVVARCARGAPVRRAIAGLGCAFRGRGSPNRTNNHLTGSHKRRSNSGPTRLDRT